MTLDLPTLLARAEITDVLTSYVHGVDRTDWDLVRRCYHSDAVDDHGLYAGGVEGLLAFLRELAATLLATSHQLGPPHIEIDGDTARAETYCYGHYERAGRDGSVRCIVQGLRYLDTFQRREGRWAIADRTVVLDWERLSDTGRLPAPAESWQRGRRGAADPSDGFVCSPRPPDARVSRY